MNAPIRTRGLVAAQANGAAIVAELSTAFASFRQKNDTRVDAIEKELDGINASIAASLIGPVDGGISHDPDARQHLDVMASFARTGKISAAMSTDSDPDGGYTVDRVLSTKIARRIYDASPIGRLARHEQITTGDSFAEPIDIGDIEALWVGEHDDRPETDTTNLRMLTVPVTEVYTNQPVTQRLLDDSAFDIAGWMNDKIVDKFGRTEGRAFISGNGVGRPRGLLTYDTSTAKDAARAWGTIQYIPTGKAAAFADASATVSPADALFDVVYSLRAPYRPGARWLMNLATAGIVRKLKDSEGRFIWADAREGQPATLCGFPVELDEEMPDVEADAFPIAFGDFRQAYIIVDKPGIRMLRDPYSAKPYVLFYAYRRVGGQLQNSEAVKILKIAAS